MTDEPLTVVKYEYAIPGVHPASDPSPLEVALREAGNRVVLNMNRWMTATAEERAEWAREAEQRRAELAQERAGLRAATPSAPLTLDALVTRMGWSREYAEHLVQPYCRCEDDIDGWSYCEHARDLGLAP